MQPKQPQFSKGQKNRRFPQLKKIRKGDRVVAIAGNSKGLAGVVQSCRGDRVIVQGLNMRKKHMKPNAQAPKGRIVEIEEPIHVSKLKVCNADNQPLKLHVHRNEQGDREFVYSQGDQQMVYRSVKKPK